MTVVNPPAWLQAGEYPAHTYRLVTSSLVQTPGVVKVGDLSVTQNTVPGMSVLVTNGRAWIRDGSAGGTPNQGMYNFVNTDPSVQLTINTAHATNYRVDRVVARVEDAEISGPNNVASLVVLAGTPASTLSGAQALTPAVPAGAINRATVVVGPSVTSITNANITNDTTIAKMYSDMTPSVVEVTSSTRPTGNSRFNGMIIFETDTKRWWGWNGSEWQFRGGKGPKAYVSRPGTWDMPLERDKLSSLEAYTGENFETAYFTFADEVSAGQGDRIKVKQSGMYQIEMSLDVRQQDMDFHVWLRAVISSGVGLPGDAYHYPSMTGTYPKGRSQPYTSRTLYLPTGAEVSFEYEALRDDTTVFGFWAGLTLVG